jgi:hypothetical protein
MNLSGRPQTACRNRVPSADEIMARIVAERRVEHWGAPPSW